MSAPANKLLVWSENRQAALDAWVRRGTELGLDLTYMRQGERLPSAAAAVEHALRRATACRCGEEPTGSPPDVCGTCVDVPANPLRAMRDAAGLSQADAAARLGMTRGAWANAEKAGKATPAMIERARAALKGGAK